MAALETYFETWNGRPKANVASHKKPVTGGGWRLKDFGKTGKTIRITGSGPASLVSQVDDRIETRKQRTVTLPKDEQGHQRTYKGHYKDGNWDWQSAHWITFWLDFEVEDS